MKFGYMLDSSSYEPHFLDAVSFVDALTQLEGKFDVTRLASRSPDTPFVEVWIDKGVERKDMSFEDLSEVYRLTPDPSGSFKCHDLCLRLWNELCCSSAYIDHCGKLVANLAGFVADTHLGDMFKWLDAHTPHGMRSLVFAVPHSVSNEPVFVPCEYVSSWDGFGDISSPAKYDPVSNRVYDVETVELSDDELAECEILSGEYMNLLGTRFSLGECSDADTWPVEEPYPLQVISGMSDLRSNPSLTDQIKAAQSKAGETRSTDAREVDKSTEPQR